MIFITTSNGVFLIRNGESKAECIMDNRHTRGWFRRKARGYFGICQHAASGNIIVASREKKFGTPSAGYPSTDCTLHSINPQTLEHQIIAEVRDLHDVHQIACIDEQVFLSDTGKNRVHQYDLKQERLVRMLNIGAERKDIHHINALYCESDALLIGLNNRGNEDSAILSLPYEKFDHSSTQEIDALRLGSLHYHEGIKHTHDIEKCNGDYLCSASHAGYVFRVGDKKPLIQADNWVRGLCCDEFGVWVGTSPIASRKERHSIKLESFVQHYSYTDYTLIENVCLQGSGQVNDLLYIKP